MSKIIARFPFSFFFAFIALASLFLKLPKVPEFFGMTHCTSCAAMTPYIPMLAAAYFSALCSAILCFRSLPSRSFRQAGFIWAIGLALTLTYLDRQLCLICIVAHTCHVFAWLFWRQTQAEPEEMAGMKMAITFFSSIAMMALFSTLNFTFLIYGLQAKSPFSTLVKGGTEIKPYVLEAVEKEVLASKSLSDYKGVLLHFVSANCAYCKQQIPKLDKIAQEFEGQGFLFYNVSHESAKELELLGPHLNWAGDENISQLFGIEGYPTWILLDSTGNIVEALAGAKTDFEERLKKELHRLS